MNGCRRCKISERCILKIWTEKQKRQNGKRNKKKETSGYGRRGLKYNGKYPFFSVEVFLIYFSFFYKFFQRRGANSDNISIRKRIFADISVLREIHEEQNEEYFQIA